ncbi:MAG TPA: gliding motility-associated C-terminal domain-containing protein [Flavipsychrobacter sp.]|nr:gliding motility-associated C-terminal domain-containing protein [Flavipsychrobacter sp.]
MKSYFLSWSVLLTFFVICTGKAQTTISTNLVATTTTSAGGVTFVIQNTNPGPILLTNVGYYVSAADNGQLYTLYYSSTSISGPQPTVWPDPNWSLVASATVNGITTTGIQDILNGLTFLIPANTTYRFSLTKGSTIPLYASSGANTFTAAGVNLFIGNYQIAGQNVGYAYTITPRYWAGSITFGPAMPPAPITSGAGAYCSGDNILLKARPPKGYDTTDYNFVWRFPDGSIHTDSVYAFPNAQAGAAGPTGLYTVYMTIDTGIGPLDTSLIDSFYVFVQQVPPPPAVQRLITYCQNSSSDTIPVYGQNIRWYSTPTGGTAVTIQPTINTAVPGTFTYYVSQTFNNCESPRAPVTVQVVPQSPPPVVTTPVNYCQDEPAVPLEAVGQNIRWYSTDTGGVGSIVVPTPSTIAQGQITWYVTQTIDGCESVRVPIQINVNYRPNALITTSADWVCDGQNLIIGYQGNAQGDVNVNFNWTFPPGVTVVNGSGEGPYELKFDSVGMQRITLVVDNNGCKSIEVRYDIEVRPIPEFELDIQDDGCVGEVVELTINQLSPGIDSFAWDIAGGEKIYASETAGPYGVKWSSGGTKTISVVGTDRECSSKAITEDIHIHWLPDATISREDGTHQICAGDTIVLHATYDANHSYQWLPESFFKENNGSHEQTAKVQYPTKVTLNVTDRFNCRATGEYSVQPENCCDVVFPTGFTPNGDGKNDFFRPVSAGHQNIALFVVKNRWGQQVYEGRNTITGWDGTYNGTAQDIGVYFYYIKYKCTDDKYYEKSGEVTLVR